MCLEKREGRGRNKLRPQLDKEKPPRSTRGGFSLPHIRPANPESRLPHTRLVKLGDALDILGIGRGGRLVPLFLDGHLAQLRLGLLALVPHLRQGLLEIARAFHVGLGQILDPVLAVIQHKKGDIPVIQHSAIPPALFLSLEKIHQGPAVLRGFGRLSLKKGPELRIGTLLRKQAQLFAVGLIRPDEVAESLQFHLVQVGQVVPSFLVLAKILCPPDPFAYAM